MVLHVSGICQDSSSNLNCLIKVDDRIVKVGFTNGFLYILDDKEVLLRNYLLNMMLDVLR